LSQFLEYTVHQPHGISAFFDWSQKKGEPMKIAFVLPGSGNSGGVRCTSIVAEMLRNRGHEVRILHAQPEFSVLNWAKAARDRILYADAPNFLAQFKGPIAVFKELSGCHFDEGEIIVAVGMIISAQIDLLGSIDNPKLQYLHGSTPDRLDRRKKAFSLPIPKIAVATYLRDLVEKEGQGEFLGVIHNGIDLGEYFPSVSESLRDGVGTIYGSHPAKDPKTVIGVLQSLSNLRPDVPLRVFSGDRRPKEISRSIYLRQPTVDRARDIYSRSQVWIMASHSEGFPGPVLEAMACGCAVVATDCGGPKDQIVDGQNGFLVPVGDVERINSRVLLLLDDPDLRKRIQRSALETARQFTWNKCADALEATLGSLVRQHNLQTVPSSNCGQESLGSHEQNGVTR
jgi:glycosyltransferase involved in cell wall biosynthesis